MPEQHLEQKYTFIHPGDHQRYHTDLRTAEMLQLVKRLEPAAYDAAFARGRETGQIAEGVAPAVWPEQRPPATEARARRGAEPSVGD